LPPTPLSLSDLKAMPQQIMASKASVYASDLWGESCAIAVLPFNAYHPQRITFPAPGLRPASSSATKSPTSSPTARGVRARFDSQELAPGPDSEWNLELTTTVALTPELLRWIFGFDQDARVIEPPELRDAIAKMTDGMRAIYSCVDS
jgi:hypothetical protein